jgi:hypothetical protein
MTFDASVVLTWILFLALFPMAFFWWRRVWRILVKRDFSEVALRRGESPPNPEHWAPYEMAINALAATAVSFVIVGVLMGALPYSAWSAIAGTTLWCKFFASFGLGRHAHLQTGRKPSSP